MSVRQLSAVEELGNEEMPVLHTRCGGFISEERDVVDKLMMGIITLGRGAQITSVC
jgi:hypothetical protein